jgi:hypothetical protein
MYITDEKERQACCYYNGEKNQGQFTRILKWL